MQRLLRLSFDEQPLKIGCENEGERIVGTLFLPAGSVMRQASTESLHGTAAPIGGKKKSVGRNAGAPASAPVVQAADACGPT
jgi:hypothetical protein